MTAMQGVGLSTLEAAALEALDRVREGGVSEDEAARARRQLRARLVFETDSVTNIAHQLGYFETVDRAGILRRRCSRASARVTAAEVSDVARRRLPAANRTVGWFQPSWTERQP